MNDVITLEGVVSMVRELSLEDKLSLSALLSQMIKVEEKENKYRDTIDKYVGTMKKLAGDNFMATKKRLNVQAKVVLATCLMEDGISLTTTSHIIGVDHSTISHYKQVWQDILKYPRMYSDVIKLYNKYREML